MNKLQKIQQTIQEKLPKGLVTPEHTEHEHWYRHAGTGELYASVTTKGGILAKGYLKNWAVKLAVKHIDDMWEVAQDDRELILWEAENKHKEVLKDASEVGTAGHEIVELYILDWMKTGKQPEDITKYITPNMVRSHPEYVVKRDMRLWAIARSAQQFCNDYYITPISSELLLASTKHGFAGTLDLLAFVGFVTKEGKGECKKHDFWQVSSKDRKFKCTHCGAKMEQELAVVDWKTSNSIDKAEYALQVAAYTKAFVEVTGLKPKNAYIVRLDKHRMKYEVVKLADVNGAFKAYLKVAEIYDWLNDGKLKLDPMKKKTIINLV